MSKNISDFFLNNFFEYENCACVCQKETVYSVPGQPPSYNLKLYSVPEQPLRFSYAAQKGLNQSGNAGGIISENILGQLLALPYNDIDATIKFFEQYGFLFPINSDEYESVDGYALLEIVNRIRATVMLMSAIAGKRDYGKIFKYTTYLLYTNPVELNLSSQSYSSAKNHQFTELIRTYNIMPNYNESQEFFEHECISIWDSILNGYQKVYIDELTGIEMGDGISGLMGSRDWHFRNLFALYTNYNIDDDLLRTTIDFYYNFQKRVGVIKDVDISRITFHTTLKKENFSDEMKEALLKIAKATISKEINANLHGICPQFDVGSFAPSWKLNSLLEALYFSIFYMKPGVELYKECENPNCKHQKYFLINATVTNKKYCCPACSNAAAQRRSRQRKLEGK